MSTKIYDGFRLRTPSIRALNAILQTAREQLSERCQEEFLEMYGQYVAAYADARIAGIKITAQVGRKRYDRMPEYVDATTFPSGIAWQEFWDAQSNIRLTHERNPSYDFECEISLYPGSPWTFAIIYSEPSRAYRDVWAEIPGVEPYAYWDNTDKPEELSSRAWKRRGDQWNKRLATKSLDWTLNGEYGAPMPPRGDDLLLCMPTLEKRLARIASHIADHDRLPDWVLPNAVEGEPKKEPPRDWFGNFIKWKTSPERKAVIAEEIERLRGILPATLSLDDLIRQTVATPAEEAVHNGARDE